jgi:membrane protein DedA with SNARE-associated domain
VNLLLALHGTAAAVVICCLLFVDELGIPLPFAPNEVLLLVTGILVAGGAFPLWIILPTEYAVMTLGMFLGYTWASTVGQAGLESLAARFRAEKMYGRAQAILRSANPWQIALARLLPGLRPHATLVSGAAGVDPAIFALAALPALAIWEVVLVLAGMLIGLPLVHLLTSVEKVVVRGGVLLALAVLAWLATRHTFAAERGGVDYVSARVRAVLALVVDAATALAVAGSLEVIARRLINLRMSGWTELLVAAVLLGALLVIARRITSPGEALFDTDYWHHSPVPPAG